VLINLTPLLIRSWCPRGELHSAGLHQIVDKFNVLMLMLALDPFQILIISLTRLHTFIKDHTKRYLRQQLTKEIFHGPDAVLDHAHSQATFKFKAYAKRGSPRIYWGFLRRLQDSTPIVKMGFRVCLARHQIVKVAVPHV
jgi:hypothetical protein